MGQAAYKGCLPVCMWKESVQPIEQIITFSDPDGNNFLLLQPPAK